MTAEKTFCDSCGRIRGAANHWHQIGVQKYANGVWIELGVIGCHSDPKDVGAGYEVHDLCGEGCFFRHLAKLLKLNPVAEGENQQ